MSVMLDLEFLGDITHGTSACRIYEIAAITENGETFQTYVDPYPNLHILPQPLHDECFHITRDFIKSNQVQPIENALLRFVQFLNELNADHITIFAHAAFRSDKPILSDAIRRTCIQWPSHIRFADTLNIARIVFPHIQQYDLASLYKHVLNNSMIHPHTALCDAIALREIVRAMPHSHHVTVTYSIDQYPLSNLPHIGAKTELYLMRSAFHPNIPSTHRAMSKLSLTQQKSINVAIRNGIFETNSNDDTF